MFPLTFWCVCVLLLIFLATPRHFAKEELPRIAYNNPSIHIRVDWRLKKPEGVWKHIREVSLSMSLALMSSVTRPDSRIHGQVTETQKSWTWRRRAPSIFSRNYLRWTEESPCLHRHRKDRRNVQPSPPYRRQALHQHPYRWTIYLSMYFTPNRLFSLLQGAVKTLLQLPGTV